MARMIPGCISLTGDFLPSRGCTSMQKARRHLSETSFRHSRTSVGHKCASISHTQTSVRHTWASVRLTQARVYPHAERDKAFAHGIQRFRVLTAPLCCAGTSVSHAGLLASSRTQSSQIHHGELCFARRNCSASGLVTCRAEWDKNCSKSGGTDSI